MFFRADIHPWIQYLIVILLVLLGNQILLGDRVAEALLVVYFIFLAPLYFLRRNSSLALSDLLVFFSFLMILAVQSISFNFFPLRTIAGFIIRLFIAFATVRLVKDFPRIYINVMYGICIISLCFYVPEQLFHAVGRDFASLFTPLVNLVRDFFLLDTYGGGGAARSATIFIYNFENPHNPHDIYRNAGPFWEPGAFAGYISLALIFLGLEREKYDRRFYISRFLVLTITLLTTVSTMGYLIMPIVLSIHYRRVTKSVVENLGQIAVGILMLPLFMALLINVWNLEFIGRKIIHQYEGATAQRAYLWEYTRFGSMIVDWKYIKRRPIFGWGIHPKTKFALDPKDERRTKGAGNGFSGFIHRFGILGMITFVLFAWKGFYKLSRESLLRSVMAILAILMSLIGEEFLHFPPYLGLMFVTVSRKTKGEGSVSAPAPSGLSTTRIQT
jgi:hypothetical protein